MLPGKKPAIGWRSQQSAFHGTRLYAYPEDKKLASFLQN